MSEYSLTPTEFKTLKSRLTRVKNSNDPSKIIAECQRAMAIFEAKGFPDNWADWDRAKLDAEFTIMRQGHR